LPVTVTPSTLALVLTSYAPTIQTPITVTPGVATLTLTTYAPSLSGDRSAAYLYYLLNT
jgi:hypothetical protein